MTPRATWGGLWLGVGLALLLCGVVAFGQERPALTEVQQLKAELQVAREELLQARYQLATCQAQQQAAVLADRRRQLETELAPAGYQLDWPTLTLKAKPN